MSIEAGRSHGISEGDLVHCGRARSNNDRVKPVLLYLVLDQSLAWF
jgi:hypothetical protein